MEVARSYSPCARVLAFKEKEAVERGEGERVFCDGRERRIPVSAFVVANTGAVAIDLANRISTRQSLKQCSPP